MERQNSSAMKKSRRKRLRSTTDENRWVISYADFITLLFAFFTVMYAMSSVSESKFREMSGSLSTAFQKDYTKQPDFIVQDSFLRNAPDQSFKTKAFKKVFTEDYRRVHAGLSSLESEKMIDVSIEDRGVVISLADKVVFGSGSANILPSSNAILDDIAESLKDMDNQIKIEGHTDNIPISSDEFASNWELSSKRALSMLEYLVDRHGFDPVKMSATGFAEHRPFATNDTPQGRAKNRRVDIVILNRQGELVEPVVRGK